MGGAWGGYRWGGATWGGSARRRRRAVSPPQGEGTWLEALSVLLAASPALSPLTAIHLKKVPPLGPRTPMDDFYPYLLISPIDYQPLKTNSRVAQWGPQIVQYTVVTTDDVQAEQLGEAAYSALAPVDGYARLKFHKGSETGRIPGFQRLTAMPGRVRGRVIWVYWFQYTHNLTKAY